MIDHLWKKFKELGFKGSVSILGESNQNGSLKLNIKSDGSSYATHIFQEVYSIDPEYKVAIIIENPSDVDSCLDEIDFKQASEKIQDDLDNAILNGLGHKKQLRIKGTQYVVRFGYTEDDIFG